MIPEVFNKYTIKPTQKQSFGVGNRAYYQDLDSDSKSERIDAQNTTLGGASLLMHNSNGSIIDQFNLEGKFLYKTKSIHFQDTNNNDVKEIFVLTKSNDSIFINYAENLSNSNPGFKKHFIDFIDPYDGEYDIKYSFYENVNKKTSKVYFAIMFGYGGSIRSVFTFDTKKGLIQKSPHLTNSSKIQQLIDLDDDNQPELLLSNHSSGNIIDSVYTKNSDYSTWINVLDDNLNYIFHPIELKAQGSIKSIGIDNGNTKRIITLFSSREYEIEPSQLLILNNTGEILRKKILPKGRYVRLIQFNNMIGVTDRDSNSLITYSYDLEPIDTKIIKNIANINPIDANNDGINEWLIFHFDYKNASIYDYNFENQVTFRYSDFLNYPLSYGIKYNGENEPEIYFQKLSNKFINYHSKNPIYILKYVTFLLIYAGTLGLVFLIIKGQKIRETKQKKLEQKIAELQLKTIKNQVDPHFVFNAVNTLSELNLMDNKMEADKFIVEFSSLMRKTLSQSDKISTSLATEINYIKNYLKLQQIRLNDSFEYRVEIDENVDTSTNIPKHSLYTYVENAIKYGRSQTELKDIITIHVKKKENCLILQVLDTGKGLHIKKDKTISTGTGLKILTKIFKLYEKTI